MARYSNIVFSVFSPGPLLVVIIIVLFLVGTCTGGRGQGRGEDLLQDGGGEVKRLRRMGKGQGILYEADGRVHR